MGLIREGWLPIAPPPTASTRSSQDSGAVVQWHSSTWPQGCKALPTSSRPHERASAAPTRPGLAGSSRGAVSAPQPEMRVVSTPTTTGQTQPRTRWAPAVRATPARCSDVEYPVRRGLPPTVHRGSSAHAKRASVADGETTPNQK